ncbi:MAG: chemotaxis protein CheW [Chloroflexi bacterium]|nr:chemotaxis protein CheW [Chloroflexota bacterium]
MYRPDTLQLRGTDREAGPRVLVFDIGGQRYALALAQVREVLPRAGLTQLPEAPAALIGLLRLRGTLLPVLDLRLRFGVSPAVPRIDQRIVVAWVGQAIMGLLVDGVDGVLALRDGAKPGEPGRAGQLVQHVEETPGGAVILLDTAALAEPAVTAFLDGVLDANAEAETRPAQVEPAPTGLASEGTP